MKKLFFAAILALTLSACDSPHVLGNITVMYDANGCAFILDGSRTVQQNMYEITRSPAQDKNTNLCTKYDKNMTTHNN